MAPPELFADVPTPGAAGPQAVATLSAAITTTPVAGTVESWAVSAAAPETLRAATGQFRVVIDNEIMIVASSSSGASPWSFTRGAEGTTIATHLVGTPIYHILTQGSLGTFVQTSTQGLTITGTPSAGQVPTATSTTAANWQTPAAGGAPSGAAGGDLSGNYPNPVVAKVAGVAITGTPTAGQVPTASSGTAAAWSTPSSGASSIGSPAVALTGTPSSGQVPTATSSSAATWQTPSGGGGGGIEASVSLQDPTLTGGAADNTGTSYVNTSFKSAIAKAAAILAGETGYAKGVTIHGAPGTYKWDWSLGGLQIPTGVYFRFGDGELEAAEIQFCNFAANAPSAIAITAGGFTAGQTTMALTNVKNAFPTNAGLPLPANYAGTTNFTYTGVTGSGASVTLTGCVGIPTSPVFDEIVTAGSAVIVNGGGGSRKLYALDRSVVLTNYNSSSGSAWRTATPPTGAGCGDGVFVSQSAAVDCAVHQFRQQHVYTNDHETFGGSCQHSGGWCNYALESPLNYNWTTRNNNGQGGNGGNQLWQEGSVQGSGVANVWWCHHYISAGNALTGCDFMPQRHEGGCVWWMWKAQTVGVTNAQGSIISSAVLYSPVCEGLGLGWIGCPDAASYISFRSTGGELIFHSNELPTGSTVPAALLQGVLQNVVVDGLGAPIGIPNTFPLWVSDLAFDSFFINMGNNGSTFGIKTAATNMPKPYTAGALPKFNVQFDGGAVVSGLGNTVQAGDVVQAIGQPDASNFPSVLEYCEFGRYGSLAPAGIALTAEANKTIVMAGKGKGGVIGPVQANTHAAGDASAVGLIQAYTDGSTFYGKVKTLATGGVLIGSNLAADSGGHVNVVLA